MLSSIIWVVLFARPRKDLSLRPLYNERVRVAADMMYIRRFSQARGMSVGDRVVVQFGGPKGSDPLAQYLVQAGCVEEEARNLNQGDAEKYKMLLDLTIEMFPEFQTAPGLFERQGIIKYRLFSLPRNVSPIFRPYPQLMPGDNFKQFVPGDPEYPLLDEWWHRVVPKGQCGKE
jgi:hypothetical protein